MNDKRHLPLGCRRSEYLQRKPLRRRQLLRALFCEVGSQPKSVLRRMISMRVSLRLARYRTCQESQGFTATLPRGRGIMNGQGFGAQWHQHADRRRRGVDHVGQLFTGDPVTIRHPLHRSAHRQRVQIVIQEDHKPHAPRREQRARGIGHTSWVLA